MEHLNAWANVETDHLPPDKKLKALNLKETWMTSQEGKRMFRPIFKTGEKSIRRYWAESTEELNVLCDPLLDALEKRPQLILLDVRGDSEMWRKKRIEIDGHREYTYFIL